MCPRFACLSPIIENFFYQDGGWFNLAPMHISNLVELAVSLILEIWLVILLLRRKVASHFPVFFIYVICALLSASARLLTIRHYGYYFYTYWGTEAVLLTVSLAALHEVFRWLFAGFYKVWWFRLAYYGTIFAVLAIAIRNALVNPPVEAHPLISVILDTGIAVNLVRIGIVALFSFLTRLLVIEFHRYVFGIVGGFGISSIGFLLSYLAFSVFGTKMESVTRIASAVAYILGLAIWVASFIRPQPEEKEWIPPMSPEQMLEEARAYLKGLSITSRKR